MSLWGRDPKHLSRAGGRGAVKSFELETKELTQQKGTHGSTVPSAMEAKRRSQPAACETQAPSFTELLLSLFVGCMTGSLSSVNKNKRSFS